MTLCGRIGCALLLLVTRTAGADRLGLYDPTDDPVSSSITLCMDIYALAGLWLMLSKRSPLHRWANERPGLSVALFLFVGPVVLALFKLC